MFTEQAVVHASQSLTSLSVNTNTTQSPIQNSITQPKTQPDSRYNFHYHQPQKFTSHSHHHPSSTQPNTPNQQQQHYHHHHHQQQEQSHNYYRPDKDKTHTLPSSLPTSIETSILRRSSIIEHCSCGLSFKVDKNTNNIITSSTSLLTLNTIYNENPTLIDQSTNQGYLTQSQNILQDAKHQNRRHQQPQQPEHDTTYKYNYHQHHAHHCHHHQNSSTAPVSIPRYKPSAPPEIHTHEYFSQESQTQDLTNTITNTTAATAPASLNALSAAPRPHVCRHSHVHAQTDFSYGSR